MLVRALTAVLLISGFLAALFWLERTWFAALIALLVAAGAYEWAKLCRFQPTPALLYAAGCLGGFAALALAFYPVSTDDSPEQLVFAAATIFWAAGVPALLRVRLDRLGPVLPLIGVAVLVPAGLAMIALPPGLLLAVLVLVWISDTAAYVGGRAFGRHKLAPAISPGKTWEGFACGLGAVLIYAIICAILPADGGARIVWIVPAGWVFYLGAAALLCIVGVLGDLFESAMKRRAGVKDSGSVLPGHGGILDRIDSAVAVLPMAAFLLQWIRAG